MTNDFSGYWVQVPNSAITDKRLSDKAFKLLCVISTYINEKGFCWPSQKTLAEKCDCERTTIARALKILIETGYIQKTNLFDDDNGQTVNAYSINYDVAKMKQECCKNATGGYCKNATGGVAKMHTEQESSEQKYKFKIYTQCAPARVRTREEILPVPEESPVTEADIERWQEVEREMQEVFTKSEMAWIHSLEIFKDDRYFVCIPTRFIKDRLSGFDFENRFAALESVRGLEYQIINGYVGLPEENRVNNFLMEA